MSYTTEDLDSAIDKLGSIELTDAEIEALTAVLASTDDEVSGFASRRDPIQKGWIMIESFKASGWKVEEGESWNIEQGSAAKVRQGSNGNIEQGSA